MARYDSTLTVSLSELHAIEQALRVERGTMDGPTRTATDAALAKIVAARQALGMYAAGEQRP